MIMGQRWWLIGASEGLGRALAQAMDRQGARLVLSARSRDRLGELADNLTSAEVLPMDVTSSASVQMAAEAVGRVDGVVFLVGAYEPMRAEAWDPEVVERMCDVNFMGAVRVMGRVTPMLLAQGHGQIVLTGSLAGYRGLPGAIGYGASKAGMMHLAETMRADLWHSDVAVKLVNPGFIRTRLTDKNSFAMPGIMSPEAAAQQVMASIEGRAFHRAFPLWFSLLFRLGRLLPQGLYERLFAPRPNSEGHPLKRNRAKPRTGRRLLLGGLTVLSVAAGRAWRR